MSYYTGRYLLGGMYRKRISKYHDTVDLNMYRNYFVTITDLIA